MIYGVANCNQDYVDNRWHRCK